MKEVENIAPEEYYKLFLTIKFEPEKRSGIVKISKIEKEARFGFKTCHI